MQTTGDGRDGIGSSLRAAMATVVVGSAAPYGYTLSIWSTGAVLVRSYGTPTIGDVFVFVAGAITAFNLLGLLAEKTLTRTSPIDSRTDRVLAGVLDWIAIGAVVGAVSLLAEIHGWVPWLVGPLVATVLHLVAAGLQLALVAVGRGPGR
jgi:hypothetical protein